MDELIEKIQNRAKVVREKVIKMLVKAGSGHSAGPLGSADFWTTLYFGEVINYRADEPWWSERDRVVLSAGHYVPVVYAVLSEAGFFKQEELDSLRALGSKLQGHPHREVGGKNQVPGIEVSAGPLGQGISQAVGMALVGKMDKKEWKVVCFLSDGEQDEGQVWEAYMVASKYQLNNLIAVIDRNRIQIDGYTEEVMPIEPLKAKLEAFGLEVMEIDGHDIKEMIEGLRRAKSWSEKPTAIVLHTVPGKGVDFMENLPEWHGKPPIAPGEAVKALEDIKRIRTLDGKIISEHE